jgi:hypothetical membrane protein
VRAKLPLATIAGVASVTVCVALALAAYLLYPDQRAFGPMTNWFSDLGDTWRNPHGATLFRLDMVVVGIGLAVFFLGLSTLTRGQHWRTRSLVALARVCGLAGAFALALSGIYSENEQPGHALWATVAFSALALSVMLLGWAALFHPGLPTWISLLAFATCSSDVVLIVARRHWLEWVAVPLLLFFVVQTSWGTWKAAQWASPAHEQLVSVSLQS